MAAKDFQHQTTPDFIRKVEEIINLYPSHLDWGENGRGIIIHSISNLSKDILPIYFRHTKFTSFVRQLNMYGFKKKCQHGDTMTFGHDLFWLGNQHSFPLIERKSKPKIKKELEAKFQRKYQWILEGIKNNEMVDEGVKELLTNLLQYKERANQTLKKVKKLLDRVCVQLKDSRLKKVSDCVKEMKGELIEIVQREIQRGKQIDAYIEKEVGNKQNKNINENHKESSNNSIQIEENLENVQSDVSLMNNANYDH